MAFAVAIARFDALSPSRVLTAGSGATFTATHRMVVKLYSDDSPVLQPAFVRIDITLPASVAIAGDGGLGGTSPNNRWYGVSAGGVYTSVPPFVPAASAMTVFATSLGGTPVALMGRLEPPLPPVPAGFSAWTSESTDFVFWLAAPSMGTLTAADLTISASMALTVAPLVVAPPASR